MANGIFNIALGEEKTLHNNVVNATPANCALAVVLFTAVEADAVLKDYANLQALRNAAGNVDPTFTGYARITLTSVDLVAAALNNGTDTLVLDVPNPVWGTAGGTEDNSLAKLLICYVPDTGTSTDSDIIPIAYYDFSATTNGQDLTASIASGGYLNITNA